MNIQKGLSLASPFFRYFSTFLFLVSNPALPPELSVKKFRVLKTYSFVPRFCALPMKNLLHG